MLDFAQRWVAEVDWSRFDLANTQIEACKGYVSPNVAESSGHRLKLPSAD